MDVTAEKQPMYPPRPEEQPPAYPGVSQPPMGFAPPPGAALPHGTALPPGAPPPGHPYPAGPGFQYGPPAGHPQPGMQAMPPGTYVAGQPVGVQPTSVVIVHQHMFRQTPVNCVCPHCSHNIITSTTAEAGGLTWLLCAGICLFGFWLGCCFIPFCVDDCQDIRHSCPNCKNTIHVFRRL